MTAAEFWLQLLITVPPILLAWTSLNNSLKGVHSDLNSRLTELLRIAAEKGELKGRADEKAEAAARTP